MCATPVCVRDCELSRWTGWSQCSSQCAGGWQSSTRCGTDTCASLTGGLQVCGGDGRQGRQVLRHQVTQKYHAAAAASEPSSLFGRCVGQECNLGPCAVQCELGVWASWTTCDSLCNGQQRRARPIVLPGSANDDECSTQSESRQCNRKCVRQLEPSTEQV